MKGDPVPFNERKGTIMTKYPRINVTFDPITYQQIKLIAEKNDRSMSDVIREYTRKSLNGDLTKDNIDYVAGIIREQLNIILRPSVERLAALSAKTCIQAGTSAYLNAEALARLVPAELQMDLEEAYEAAKIKAVRYIKQKGED